MILSNLIFDEALAQRVLVRKGLVIEQEIIDEIQEVRRKMLHKRRTLDQRAHLNRNLRF
jgi:hypothetical protein